LGEFLHRSLAPRIFAAAVAAAFAIACFRVASVPTTDTSYTPETSLSNVIEDFQLTVAGMRREVLEQRATYTRMGNDTRALKERLSSTGSN